MATEKKQEELEEKKLKTPVFNLGDADEFQIEITGTIARASSPVRSRTLSFLFIL